MKFTPLAGIETGCRFRSDLSDCNEIHTPSGDWNSNQLEYDSSVSNEIHTPSGDWNGCFLTVTGFAKNEIHTPSGDWNFDQDCYVRDADQWNSHP